MVDQNRALSDSFADLQIRIKGSKQDVEELFESLKQLDTRTSMASLVDIAAIVAKKGVVKDSLVEITQALDNLFVVLGKEAGEPAEATASIIKLISIFNEDKKVTAERVNEIGTAMFKLTTSGVATGSFLIDFAERVGAVRGITGLTLPNILGMGAALQQLGQHAEVAGTASIQITTKLFSNVPKFAAAAKLSIEEFRALLKENPFEALVTVAESLAQLSEGEIATNFEEITEAMGEVNVTGARVKAVLGDIATNGHFVRDRMAAAAVGVDDYGRALEATRSKQESFAAILDRIKKEFELIGSSATFRATIAAISTAVLGLIKMLPTLIVLLGLMGAAWLAQNAVLIASRLTLIGYNIALGASYIAMGLLYVAQAAYIGGLALLRAAWAATTIVARAFMLMWAANPFGIFVAGATMVITTLGAIALKMSQAKDRLKEYTGELKSKIAQTRIEMEVQSKANEIIGEQVTKLETLVGVIASTAVSADVAKAAFEELTKSYAIFGTAMTDGVINLNKLRDALGEVTKEIQLNANAQASAQITAGAYKDYLLATTVRQKAERTRVTHVDPKKYLEKMTPEERALTMDASPLGGLFSPEHIKILKEREEQAKKEYLEYLSFSTKAKAELLVATEKNAKATHEAEVKTLEQRRLEAVNLKLTQAELENFIDGINKELAYLKEGDAKIGFLIAQRKEFEKRLAALKGEGSDKEKERPYRGARIPGEEKDEFSRVDARIKSELAAEEERFARLRVVMVDGQVKLHQATYEEEVAHERRMVDIEEQGLLDKLAILEKKKNLNAKELEMQGKFRLDYAQLQVKHLEKLDQLNQRQFEFESRQHKKRLDALIAQLRAEQAALEEDPNVSNEDKAKGKKEMDDKIIEATKQYYVILDALSTKYSISQQTIEEEKQKAIADLERQGLTNRLKIARAILQDIDDAYDRNVANIRSNYSKLRLEVIENTGNPAKRKAALERLDREEEETIAAADVAAASVKLQQLKKDFAAGMQLESRWSFSKQYQNH
jgi:TP901 family phage tail tape measure protein